MRADSAETIREAAALKAMALRINGELVSIKDEIEPTPVNELIQAREQLTIVQKECTKLLLEKRELESRVQGQHRENQQSISDWANETFGPSGSNIRVATRANEEMAELLGALSISETHAKAPEEIADVFIVLYRLGWRLGLDIHEEIDRKMAVNRARKWKLDGSGHGYHVKSAE